MIFPYQQAIDYYESQARRKLKGKVFKHKLAFALDLDEHNAINFKRRCLGSNGLLFATPDVTIGVISQLQKYKGTPYLTFGLYFNALKSATAFQLYYVDKAAYPKFWATQPPPSLDANTLHKQEVLLDARGPICTVQMLLDDRNYQLHLPNQLCLLLKLKEVKLKDFKLKWKQNLQNIIRTEPFKFNYQVCGNPKVDNIHVHRCVAPATIDEGSDRAE